MADFTLSRESVEIKHDYNVDSNRFENQWELSRLITPNKLIRFKIKTPNKNKEEMMDYVDFFDSKYGSATSFTFQCPLDDEIYDVKFVKGSFKTLYRNGYFQGEFELERVFT